MVKDNLYYIPKENIYKTEEVRYLNTEIPSYEEFAKSYKSDKVVEESYWLENQSQEKGYGPCYGCKNHEIAFTLEIVLKNSRGGSKSLPVWNVESARNAASKISRNADQWSDNSGAGEFSNTERSSLVDKINSAIDEHINYKKVINRVVESDVYDKSDDASGCSGVIM